MLTLTRKVWDKVGYKGLGSMEFKIRLGTNTPVIMEPTVGRTDFQSEIAVLNGVNIPATAYYDLAGLPAPIHHEPVKVTKLVDGPAHLMAARVFMTQSADLGLKKWLSARKGRKRYMIFRGDDYGPFLSSIYYQVRSTMGDLLELLAGTKFKRKVTAKLAR